jgi:hypothetical protein
LVAIGIVWKEDSEIVQRDAVLIASTYVPFPGQRTGLAGGYRNLEKRGSS